MVCWFPTVVVLLKTEVSGPIRKLGASSAQLRALREAHLLTTVQKYSTTNPCA